MRDIIALPSFIFGFHGCEQEVAEKVLAGEQRLKASENDYDWLGSGVYFWEHNAKRALEWANELKNRGKIKYPSVIGAIIDLGNCLNLLDSDGLKIVKEGYAWLAEAVRECDESLPQNKDTRDNQDLLLRNLDCAVINLIHELRDENGKIFSNYDTVRAAFIEGEPLYPNAGFRAKNHIQICVRNYKAIKAVFRVNDLNTCRVLKAADASEKPCDDCGLICTGRSTYEENP